MARRPGAEIALVDTPGIHKPEYRLNAAMVHDAKDALGSADLVLFVVDAAGERGPGERYIADLVAKGGAPAVLVPNKIDRIRKEKLLPLIAELTREGRRFAEVVPVSARTGRERGATSSRCSRRGCRKGEPAYPEDFLTSTPETEWIAEVIREKLLERTRDELPFAHAVLIESVREAEDKDLTVVIASIVVEREGQKGIVVGKGGTMIRDIGKRRARRARRGARPAPLPGADGAREGGLAQRRSVSVEAEGGGALAGHPERARSDRRDPRGWRPSG